MSDLAERLKHSGHTAAASAWRHHIRSPQEQRAACEGMFYVIALPRTGWQVIAIRADHKEMGHVEAWEKVVLPLVAEQWSRALNLPAVTIESELKTAAYGFPRGRVSKVGRRYMVFHGGDFTAKRFVSKKEVEHPFGIAGICSWKPDEHERCLAGDKEAVRQLLRLEADWPAQ